MFSTSQYWMNFKRLYGQVAFFSRVEPRQGNLLFPIQRLLDIDLRRLYNHAVKGINHVFVPLVAMCDQHVCHIIYDTVRLVSHG